MSELKNVNKILECRVNELESVAFDSNEKQTLNLRITGTLKNSDLFRIRNWITNSEFNGNVNLDLSKTHGLTGIIDKVFCIDKELGDIDDFGGLLSVNLPSTVESIGYRSFFGCSKLRQCNIPESVKEIGKSAFAFCSSLENVTLLSSAVPFCAANIKYSVSEVPFSTVTLPVLYSFNNFFT